jgi:hypothetical protein
LMILEKALDTVSHHLLQTFGCPFRPHHSFIRKIQAILACFTQNRKLPDRYDFNILLFEAKIIILLNILFKVDFVIVFAGKYDRQNRTTNRLKSLLPCIVETIMQSLEHEVEDSCFSFKRQLFKGFACMVAFL